MIRTISKIAIVFALALMPSTVTDDVAIADKPVIKQMTAIPVVHVKVAKLPVVVLAREFSAEDLRCMVLNLYHEARGEDARGIAGVGWVVLNRKADKYYPNSICGVVQQGGERRRFRCQFTWWCDGLDDEMTERAAVETLTAIAKALLRGEIKDPTKGSLNYHATYVTPYWSASSKLKHTVKLGKHLFYKPKNRS